MNHSPRDVLITGLGPVTSIGTGREALWAALMEGRCSAALRDMPVDPALTATIPIAAMPPHPQVPGLERHLAFLGEQDAGGCRDLAYGLLAAELALADAGLEVDRENNHVGIVQAFEAPGMEMTVATLFGMIASMGSAPPPPSPTPIYDALAPRFYQSQAFLYVHLAGKALGCHGFSTSIHNACTSGAFALEVAADRIREGRAGAMVVMGGEAFESAVRLEWFRRLELYAEQPAMCPFAATPTGFFVGEGGGAIVLESREHAEKRGAVPYAVYHGGAFAQQSWKQTIPDVRSNRLATVIGQALERGGIGPDAIDFVVPHGAATALSDRYEAQGLQQHMPPSASGVLAGVFKPRLGHLLAASGLVETICTLLALRHRTVPAAPADAAAFPARFVSESTSHDVRHVLKIATGFTGHDAAAVYSRPE